MSGLSRPTGFQDWVGPRARDLATVERTVGDVLDRYTFEPIRLPMMETIELFKRGVGDATDIVEKEMFLLESRGEDDNAQFALRPEGTASTVRALQQEGLLYNQQQRVYYGGSMFRYERPQKGRYREFYQIGVEAFGFSGPDLDAELLLLARDCWAALGIAEHLSLELNTIGSAADRAAFGAALKAYLEPLASELDEDSQRRLLRNPLRILDSKDARTQALLVDAPKLEDFVNDAAREHFAGLTAMLDGLGVTYQRNDRLVRGLDYYNNTVFEWTTTSLGAQGTVCGGGRYDGLVALLGGKAMPAAGFAMGLDRIVLLREVVARQARECTTDRVVDVYFCVAGAAQQQLAEALAGELRKTLPTLKLRVHLGGGKLDKQLKRADQSGAQVALILGSNEAESGTVMVKPLRDDGASEPVSQGELAARLVVLLKTEPCVD